MKQPDVDVIAEAVLAVAQSMLYKEMRDQGISPAELAKRLGVSVSTVRRMFESGNLFLKRYAKAMAVCGKRVEISIS